MGSLPLMAVHFGVLPPVQQSEHNMILKYVLNSLHMVYIYRLHTLGAYGYLSITLTNCITYGHSLTQENRIQNVQTFNIYHRQTEA